MGGPMLLAMVLAALAADPPAGTYLGRPVAPTMSHRGADWLTRPDRARQEDTPALLRALCAKPGDVVCDLGAGNGYLSLPLARQVAPDGRVVAADLQPEMLAKLEARAAAQGVGNVRTVLSAPEDPRLPVGACDLVLLVDVYHELSAPAAVLRHVRAALSPSGRVAIVEFRAEDPKVPIKPEHKMSRARVEEELRANGFAPAGVFDGLPWQHLLFFR